MSFEERIQRQKVVTAQEAAQHQRDLVQRQTDEQRRKALFEEYKVKFDQAIKATPEYAAAQAILDDPELNEAALAIGKLMQVSGVKAVNAYNPPFGIKLEDDRYRKKMPEPPHVVGPLKIGKSISYDSIYSDWRPGYIKSVEDDFPRMCEDVLRFKKTIKAELRISCELKHNNSGIFSRSQIIIGQMIVVLPFFQISTDSQITYRCGNDYLNRSMSELLDVLAKEIPSGRLPDIVGQPLADSNY